MKLKFKPRQTGSIVLTLNHHAVTTQGNKTMGHRKEDIGWTRNMSNASVSQFGLCLNHIIWLPQLLRDAMTIEVGMRWEVCHWK